MEVRKEALLLNVDPSQREETPYHVTSRNNREGKVLSRDHL
jgi:hypothetical protein